MSARTEAGGPNVLVLDDVETIAAKSAELFVDVVGTATRDRGVAHVALTGGSSAAPFFRRLGDPGMRERVDWDRVHVWWGDERYVPADHPLSNAGLAYGVLFDVGSATGESGQGGSPSDAAAGQLPGVSMPADNIHPFPVDAAVRESREPHHAAEQHAAELLSLVPADADGVPVFDLILLGVGPDGHVLSVFPDSLALRPDAPLVVAVPAPTHIEPHVPRLTLNPRVLGAARNVIVTASGSGKAGVLGEIFGPTRDPRRLPAQLALTPAATWLIDRAAATRLTLSR